MAGIMTPFQRLEQVYRLTKANCTAYRLGYKLFKAGLQKGALLPTRDGAKYCSFANISPILLNIFRHTARNCVISSRCRENAKKCCDKDESEQFCCPSFHPLTKRV